MKCGACGREQSVGGLFCQYCGAGISSPAAGQWGAVKSGPCPCGRLLTPQDLFCPACGRARNTTGGTPAGSVGASGFPPPNPQWGAGGYGQNPGLPPSDSYSTGGYSPGGYSPGGYSPGGCPPGAFPPQSPGYGPSYLPVPYPPAQPVYPYRRKDKVSAGVLALLLGAFGAHKFYLGQPGMGILYLLLILTPIPWIASLVEGITYLAQSDESFDARFNSRY